VLHVAPIPRCDDAVRSEIHLPNTKTKPSETNSTTTATERVHYEREGYAHEEYSSESINVNLVCSWTFSETADGPAIDIGNPHCGGWRITPRTCPLGKANCLRFAQRLREVNSGPPRTASADRLLTNLKP
jgi:hypothetical protein